MTENEKAKAYDEALKKASAAHKDEDRHLKATLERIFPELKEDDNERIRKNCIDWLEKQGEQKPQGKSALEAIKEENVDNANKVEPKFKVGDRIKHKVTNKDNVYEITKVYDDSYGIAGFN